jgi:hypothetical protein
VRERKLRAFGVVDGEKISDPRNYLYLELKLANLTSAVAVTVKLKNHPIWRSGDLGRVDYAVSRSGWVRTTVELPPATRPEQIGEIGFDCVVAPGPDRKLPPAGECRVEAVTKVFLLDRDYRPGANIWSLETPVGIPAGEMHAFPLP